MAFTSFSSGLSLSSNVTLSGSNLIATSGNASDKGASAVHHKLTGKWYFEVGWNAIGGVNTGMGIRGNGTTYGGLAADATGGSIVFRSGNAWVNGTSQNNVGSLISATSCCAVDLDNKKIWFRTNGGSWNAGGGADPATNTGGYDISAFAAGAGIYPCVIVAGNGDAGTANFGASAFAQTIPSGFAGWSDSNEGKVSIDLGSEASAHASGVSNYTVSLPGTDGTNRIVVVVAHSDGSPSVEKDVTSVSGGSLTWTKHKLFSYTGNGHDAVEVWWALAATALGSTTITVTFAGTIDDSCIGCFGVAGANTTTPFDTDASIPSTATNTVSSQGQVTGVSTAGADGLLLGVWSNDNGPTSNGIPTQGSNYAKVLKETNSGGTNWSLLMVEGLAYTSARSSVTVGTTVNRADWGMIATAIQAAASEADLTASMSMGFSEAATVTREKDLTASMAVGFSEAASFANTKLLTVSMALGASETATVTRQRLLSASAAVGFAMADVITETRRHQPVVVIGI